MNIQTEILVNKYGQGVLEINILKQYFDNLLITEKRDFLEDLLYLIIQSKPNNDDIDLAIKKSGLKSTFTPCVVLRKGIANNNLYKLINLPDSEIEKTLVLLMNLFKIAYIKRYNVEKNNPDKWWYWDLSQSNIEEKILKFFN